MGSFKIFPGVPPRNCSSFPAVFLARICSCNKSTNFSICLSWDSLKKICSCYPKKVQECLKIFHPYVSLEILHKKKLRNSSRIYPQLPSFVVPSFAWFFLEFVKILPRISSKTLKNFCWDLYKIFSRFYMFFF